MASLRGGMEFRRGRTVATPAPPVRLETASLRVTCRGAVRVRTGQQLAAGEVLEEATPGQPAEVSPVAAAVQALVAWKPDGPDRPTATDVLLKPVDASSPTSLDVPVPEKPLLAPWLERLAGLGAWPQDALRLDLVTQLSACRQSPPSMLVCNALDPFPPYPTRSSLLASFRDEAALGLSMLGRVTGARELVLATDLAQPISGLRRTCRGFDIRLRQVENAYPWASPTVLLYELTAGRLRMPHGGDPMRHGVLLVTPWTVIRLARWATEGRLDTVQPYFIGWASPDRNLAPRWGFPWQRLSELDPALSGTATELAGRVVIGDPMTGSAPQAPQHDAPELPPTAPAGEHLLSLLPSFAPRLESPCVHCGWCVDVCPTRLRPIQLMHDYRHARGEPAVRQRLQWCIDCGLCSHVCPSHIPIAQALRSAKREAGAGE